MTTSSSYDIINCLNKNLITHFVCHLGKEKRYHTETLSIDRVLHKEHFVEKSSRKCASKTSPKLQRGPGTSDQLLLRLLFKVLLFRLLPAQF